MEKNFFEFIYKRHLIWHKRFVLKSERPWSDDFVLNTYKLINVYRELDKCTLYIIDKLKNVKDRRVLFLNLVFYRFFNQYELYEKLGVDVFSVINEEIKIDLIERLERFREEGNPIFNNAYLISGIKGQKKHFSVIESIMHADIDNLLKEIDNCSEPKDSLKIIEKIPMVGPFLACEIWTDLSYFNFFKQGWNDNDFVNIGPGAKWGLEIIYSSRLNGSKQIEKLSELHKLQIEILPEIHNNLGEHLSWKDIAYKDAFSYYPFLSITNIEGSLCEFRKYWNISQNKGRRKYYKPLDYK